MAHPVFVARDALRARDAGARVLAAINPRTLARGATSTRSARFTPDTHRKFSAPGKRWPTRNRGGIP
jgi:hypothetical protein